MKLPIFFLVSCSSPVFPVHFLLIYSEFSGRGTKSHLRNSEPDSESKVCHSVIEFCILKQGLSQNSYKNTSEITQGFLNFLPLAPEGGGDAVLGTGLDLINCQVCEGGEVVIPGLSISAG